MNVAGAPAIFQIVSLAVLLAACCGLATAAEVVVVVSADSPHATLSRSRVADIFLGKARAFPNGRAAQPVDLPEGNAVRDAFYAQFTGRNAPQLKAHWAKMIFTGRGRPPTQAADIDSIRRALQGNPDAIAYLPPDAIDERLQIVETD